MSAAKQQLPDLPDDPAQLKEIILQLSSRVNALEEYIRLEKLRKFAARSEKSASQYELFNEAELADAAEEILAEQEAERSETPKSPRRQAGRKPLPADLPRIHIEHDLPDEDKQCPCGCTLTAIGEDSSEQLDIVPAKIRVLVNVRKKYACKQCEGTVKTAPLPAQPIPKSNA